MPDTPTTTSTTPTPPASFTSYLISFLPYHIVALLILAALVGIVWGVFYIRDLQTELKAQQTATATLEQKFQQIGTTGTVVAGNTQQPANDVTQQAAAIFGQTLQQYMSQEGAIIQSLTNAIGTVKTTNSPVATVTTPETPFTPVTHNVSGALVGYDLPEIRSAGPSLDSVDLSYDPTQTDPAKAFAGTYWTHNQEVFNASIGDWTKKDSGMQTSIKLTRTVSKPDPLHPGQLISLGTEDIPLTGASTIFSPTGLVSAATVVVPRWTLDLGVTHSGSLGTSIPNQYSPFGTIDYRFSSRYGAFMGTSNGGLVGGISIRLDSK